MSGRVVALVLGCFTVAITSSACGADDPVVVGVWRNGSGQVLQIGADLRGVVTQAATCTPALSVLVVRDPYDGYAVRFQPNQRVYYPPEQAKLFSGENFCASKKSTPMCNFCLVDGQTMSCESPEQDIAGAGVGVVHNCTWTRLMTAPSIEPPPSCGPEARDPICVLTSTGTSTITGR